MCCCARGLRGTGCDEHALMTALLHGAGHRTDRGIRPLRSPRCRSTLHIGREFLDQRGPNRGGRSLAGAFCDPTFLSLP